MSPLGSSQIDVSLIRKSWWVWSCTPVTYSKLRILFHNLNSVFNFSLSLFFYILMEKPHTHRHSHTQSFACWAAAGTEYILFVYFYAITTYNYIIYRYDVCRCLVLFLFFLSAGLQAGCLLVFFLFSAPSFLLKRLNFHFPPSARCDWNKPKEISNKALHNAPHVRVSSFGLTFWHSDDFDWHIAGPGTLK